MFSSSKKAGQNNTHAASAPSMPPGLTIDETPKRVEVSHKKQKKEKKLFFLFAKKMSRFLSLTKRPLFHRLFSAAPEPLTVPLIENRVMKIAEALKMTVKLILRPKLSVKNPSSIV